MLYEVMGEDANCPLVIIIDPQKGIYFKRNF
jgi:hypothetical protein